MSLAVRIDLVKLGDDVLVYVYVYVAKTKVANSVLNKVVILKGKHS